MRLQIAALLVTVFCQTGTALADPAHPFIRASLAISPVSGTHSTGQLSSRINGKAVLASVEFHGRTVSLGVDALLTGPLTLSDCCVTHLGALAPYLRAKISRAFDLRVGEYVLAQNTTYPPNTSASRQGSRLVGNFWAATYSTAIGRTDLTLDVAAAPALHGRIITIFPIAGATFDSNIGEHGSLVTFRAIAANHVGHVSLFAGVVVVDFAAYFDNDGKLADRNSGLLPMIGIATPL